MSNRFPERLRNFLEDLPQKRHLRESEPSRPGHVYVDGQECVDFSSNDYLGLARHPSLIAAACEWTGRFGAGSGASRLITGNHPANALIESRVARLKQCEAALVMPSGFSANSTVLAAILDQRLHGRESGAARVRVFADRLVHASIHFGIEAAGQRQIRFRHNDLEHLSTLLRESATRDPDVLPIIVTESVFSMDGDCANIAGLRELAAQFDAVLYIDEAHATGVLGPGGAGLAAQSPASASKLHGEIVVTTFGKALGSFGACVACSHELREYLVNRCAGLIYATALPPAVLGSVLAALDLLPELEPQRRHVQQLAEWFRTQMSGYGYDVGKSASQIVPLMIGDDDRAMQVAGQLRQRGFLVVAIRPPTVPTGTSRLRVSFSAAHTMEQVEQFASACREVLA